MITHEVKYNLETNQIEEFKEFNNGKLVAWEVYHPNGQLKSIKNIKGLVNYNENGELHGPRIAYIENTIYTKTTYRNGKRNGVYIKYDIRNGGLDLICHFKNDKKDGLEKIYGVNGEIISQRFFINGVEEKFVKTIFN